MLMNIRFKKAREQSGQSTIEYIILVTAVIGVIILFMSGNNNLFQAKLNSTLGETVNQIKSKGTDLADSHATPTGQSENSTITVDPTQNIL